MPRSQWLGTIKVFFSLIAQSSVASTEEEERAQEFVLSLGNSLCHDEISTEPPGLRTRAKVEARLVGATALVMSGLPIGMMPTFP